VTVRGLLAVAAFLAAFLVTAAVVEVAPPVAVYGTVDGGDGSGE
jgi:hypothetical protein